MKSKDDITTQALKQISSGNLTTNEDVMLNMLQDIRSDLAEMKITLAALIAKP